MVAGAFPCRRWLARIPYIIFGATLRWVETRTDGRFMASRLTCISIQTALLLWWLDAPHRFIAFLQKHWAAISPAGDAEDAVAIDATCYFTWTYWYSLPEDRPVASCYILHAPLVRNNVKPTFFYSPSPYAFAIFYSITKCLLTDGFTWFLFPVSPFFFV